VGWDYSVSPVCKDTTRRLRQIGFDGRPLSYPPYDEKFLAKRVEVVDKESIRIGCPAGTTIFKPEAGTSTPKWYRFYNLDTKFM